MPYITQQAREELATGLVFPRSAGELNYALTKTIVQYLKDKGKSYATINDILGALEGAKLEFYRRVADEYENTKIWDNGDVYD